MTASFAIDHVILVVRDLDRAAHSMLEVHGLGSVDGGRHPGHGTGNRIIPLGSSYVELMSVLDPVEAEASPMGRWAMSHLSDGLVPAAVCLRTDAIESVAGALGVEPLAMARRTPAGGEVSWRLAGLDDMFASGWPFFIQWDSADHPGRSDADHRTHPLGIESVEIAPIPPHLEEIRRRVPGLLVSEGVTGPRVAIATKDGTVWLGSPR